MRIWIRSGVLALFIANGFLAQVLAEGKNVKKLDRAIRKCIKYTMVERLGMLGPFTFTTSCGPFGLTLLPAGWVSTTRDIFEESKNDKIGILINAATYAADREAGREVSETGLSLLDAAYEQIRMDFGISDEHEMNRLMIDIATAGSAE